MAAKKVGTLIKEARTNAGLTQEQLAKKIKGLSASDISKAERGEKELTQDQLKAIAKATGVTQKSLLDAAKGSSSSSGSSGSSSSSGAKTGSMKLSAAEKKLVELYRKADSDTKKKAVELLSGEKEEASSGGLLEGLFGGSSSNSGSGNLLNTLLGGVSSALGLKEMPADADKNGKQE